MIIDSPVGMPGRALRNPFLPLLIPLTFLIIFFLKRQMRQLHRRMKRDTASHAK